MPYVMSYAIFGVLFKYIMFYIMSEVRCAMVCQSFIWCAIIICHNVYLDRYKMSSKMFEMGDRTAAMVATVRFPQRSSWK